MSMRSWMSMAVVAAALLAVCAQAAETLKVDRAHSFVNFEIKHTVSSVTGAFNDFAGTIQFDPADPAQSSVELTIETASVDTGVEPRDNHLRTADFFDAEKNPRITFKSKRIAKKSGDVYDVTGDFTMHGVTKSIVLPVTFLGEQKFGKGVKAGFETSLTINREDYGLTWNRALESGGVLVGEEVEIDINIEADLQQAPPTASN